MKSAVLATHLSCEKSVVKDVAVDTLRISHPQCFVSYLEDPRTKGESLSAQYINLKWFPK